MKQLFKFRWLRNSAVLATALAVNAGAQSNDALLDKLVDKGILTVKEANDLREETDKNFSQAYAVKSGMPEFVSAFKFNGDVRVRFENFTSDGQMIIGGRTNSFISRNRYRYRLRLGTTVSMFDNFEAGLKLTSSDPAKGDSSFGGDPISGNTTFRDNASKKFVYIDLAYAKWYGLNQPDAKASLTVGKMENPFVTSDMVFDPDYTPEGVGVQSSYRLNDAHSLKLNLGGFILDELEFSSNDPYLLGAQGRWDAAWSKKISTTLGVAALMIDNAGLLVNGAVPNQNVGNTRVPYSRDTAGSLSYNFNPILVDAGLTYTLDSFPLYKGTFPIKMAGEYMNNPAASSARDNYGWNAGVTFGKSGKKGTWELSYTYKWLGADAWYEELVDSDFGALYFRGPNSFAGNGSIFSGYGSGTNAKGHIVKLAYSPVDCLTLSVKWFGTSLINAQPAGSDSAINRFQADASLKF